jgi:hypothetical protein
MFTVGDACKWCPAGQFTADGAATECTMCPAGKYHDPSESAFDLAAERASFGMRLANSGRQKHSRPHSNNGHGGTVDPAHDWAANPAIMLSHHRATVAHVCHDCAAGTWTAGREGVTACAPMPTAAPTPSPSAYPTKAPTKGPTSAPTDAPTAAPTAACVPGRYRYVEAQPGAPLLTAVGGTTETVAQDASASYSDSGAWCSDALDGLLNTRVVTQGDLVDRAVPATYHIRYTCANSRGVEASWNKAVHVLSTAAYTDYQASGQAHADYKAAATLAAETLAVSAAAVAAGSANDFCVCCTLGQYSDTYNAASCSSCANGRYASASAVECTDCPVGKYHASTGDSCTDCEAGKIAAVVAQTSCDHCPSGKYQDAAVYHKCDACGTGFWTSDRAGVTECVAVPTPTPTDSPTPSPTKAPTTASPTKSPTASPTAGCVPGYLRSAYGECVPCAPGKFSARYNADRCAACAAGTYAAAGSSACTACSPGSFWPSAGGAACFLCGPDSFAASAGATACAVCATGRYSAMGAAACIDAVPVITILGLPLLTVEEATGAHYVDDSASCSDQLDGLLSESVQVTGQVVDLATPGVYHVVYHCRNSFGRAAAQQTRTVTVDAAAHAHATQAPTAAAAAAAAGERAGESKL